jgi:hypothetical protein
MQDTSSGAKALGEMEKASNVMDKKQDQEQKVRDLAGLNDL